MTQPAGAVRTRTQKRPPRARRLAIARPRVLVVSANELLAARVARSLAELRARIETHQWEKALDLLGEEEVRAVVLVEPVAHDLATPAAVELCCLHPREEPLPTYVLTSGPCSTHHARQLYRAGAASVLEWPREESILALVLAELLGMAMVRGPVRGPDAALARTVRSHLRIRQDFPLLRIQCREGVVSVSGELSSLARKREIVDVVASVPGVLAVEEGALRVGPSGITDGTLKRRIQSVLRAALIDSARVDMTVESGRVRVELPASERSMRADLETLLERLRGVRGLVIRVAREKKRRGSSGRQAARIRRDLALLYPKAGKLEVTLFGSVAVLSGSVNSLSTKRAVGRTVRQYDSVDRVVNKLAIRAR